MYQCNVKCTNVNVCTNVNIKCTNVNVSVPM